jgi:hypothetical protein
VLIPFIGYAQDRRIIGRLETRGESLADLLNRASHVLLRDSFVESLEDDVITSVGDAEVDPAGLYAVEGWSGSRAANPSDVSRRCVGLGPANPRSRRRIHLHLGPYAALGSLPESPGQLVLPHLGEHGPMIELSDATIGFAGGGRMNLRDVGSLVVNRDLADWVRADEDEAPAFDGARVVSNLS